MIHIHLRVCHILYINKERERERELINQTDQSDSSIRQSFGLSAEPEEMMLRALSVTQKALRNDF